MQEQLDDDLPSEDRLAEMAYTAWRAAVGDTSMPAWDRASCVTQTAWLNRVGGYLELRWSALEDRDQMDRHVREVCEAKAFPAGEK